MRAHRFAVGLLTELAPHEQPHLLGLNENAGQAIRLRLRTDLYDGFRPYSDVRRVLCHELTHNVWGDHDNNVRPPTCVLELWLTRLPAFATFRARPDTVQGAQLDAQ